MVLAPHPSPDLLGYWEADDETPVPVHTIDSVGTLYKIQIEINPCGSDALDKPLPATILVLPRTSPEALGYQSALQSCAHTERHTLAHGHSGTPLALIWKCCFIAKSISFALHHTSGMHTPVFAAPILETEVMMNSSVLWHTQEPRGALPGAQDCCLEGGKGRRKISSYVNEKQTQTTRPDPTEQNNPNKYRVVRTALLKPYEYLACPHVKYMTLCKDQAKEVHDFFLIYGPSNGLFIAEQLCGKIHPLQNVIVHQAV